jgi:putative FmdB family regulatory protein
MPIYEYKCENGHLFEVQQRMVDDPLSACEQCGAPVERVFHPIAVHFKGSGFYSTDYGSKKAAAEKAAASASTNSSDKSSSDSKPDSKSDSSSSDSKSSGSDSTAKASSD